MFDVDKRSDLLTELCLKHREEGRRKLSKLLGLVGSEKSDAQRSINGGDQGEKDHGIHDRHNRRKESLDNRAQTVCSNMHVTYACTHTDANVRTVLVYIDFLAVM